jgi:hypothetical protein
MANMKELYVAPEAEMIVVSMADVLTESVIETPEVET